jgi:hypothetical protein
MNGLNIFVTNGDGSTELTSVVFAGLQPGAATAAIDIRVYNAEEFDVEVNYLAASTINLIDVAADGEDTSAANRAGLEAVAESWLEARLLETDPWTPINAWTAKLGLGTIASGDYVEAQIRVKVPAGATTFGSMSFCLAVHSRTLPPVISSFSPTSATNTASTSIDIVGDRFKTGALAYLKLSGETTILGTSTTVTSSAAMSATFAIADAVSGAWTLSVRNPENVVGTASAAFTISGAPVAESDPLMIVWQYGGGLGITNLVTEEAVELTPADFMGAVSAGVQVTGSSESTGVTSLDITGIADLTGVELAYADVGETVGGILLGRDDDPGHAETVAIMASYGIALSTAAASATTTVSMAVESGDRINYLSSVAIVGEDWQTGGSIVLEESGDYDDPAFVRKIGTGTIPEPPS